MTSQEGEKNTGRHLILIGRMIKIHLLLEACFDFKAESDYEGVNWESKRTKYEQIKQSFVNNILRLKMKSSLVAMT